MNCLALLIHEMAGETAARRKMLTEALVGLIFSRLALRFVSFDRIESIFTSRVSFEEQNREKRHTRIADVRWAVFRARRYLPGDTVCFPRAITAQWMLRRRGISTQIYYGARSTSENGLKTHVWLRDGDTDVINCKSAPVYHTLAQYNNASSQKCDTT